MVREYVWVAVSVLSAIVDGLVGDQDDTRIGGSGGDTRGPREMI
jgi:hypothetical protein